MNKTPSAFSKCRRHPKKLVLIIVIVAILLITVLRKHSVQQNHQKTNGSHPISRVTHRRIQPEVLLIYVYSRTHSHALGNLKYFIEHTVQEDDGVDYYFILQNVNNKTVNESELPSLPTSNAHYIQHDNVCFDFGTVGWFLNTYTVGNPWLNQTTIADSQKKLNLTHYKHFILINSSIRGPFFPPYYLKFLEDYKKEFDQSFYWYYIFTKRINEQVKLVGCTISCIPIPHVQSYLLVTDFIGLSLLLKPGSTSGSNGVFACFELKIHASFHSEVPSSTRILDAGYLIDCVLTKYQTINFKEPHNQLCNGHKNPYVDNNLDGTQLEPYEVIFMKYNDTPDTQIGRRRCELYERWMRDATRQNRSIW